MRPVDEKQWSLLLGRWPNATRAATHGRLLGHFERLLLYLELLAILAVDVWVLGQFKIGAVSN